jgi:type IV pilus assembly protein PilN
LKPLHLNLASKPYRDERPFYAAVVLLVLALGFLLINNVQTAVQYFSATRNTRTEIADLQKAIAAEEKKSADAQAQIKKLDLRALNSRVSYVNAEIAERAFSWSALLDQLERVLPNNVKITTLTPTIGKDGETHLLMACVAKDGSGLIRFLNNLLANGHFARPFPQTEAKMQDGSYQFSIAVDYLPAQQTAAIGGGVR